MPYANVCEKESPCRLYYEIHQPTTVKSDNLVFFIHGFLNEGHMWKPQIDHFVKQGYRVLSFDNRGIGRSSHTIGRYTTKQLACDAMSLLISVGYTPQKTHLIAQSLGGMISIELLALLSEGEFRDITNDTSFLSAVLMVTQSKGWFSGGFPPMDFNTLLCFIKVGLPWIPSLEKMDAMNSLTFSKDWLNTESKDDENENIISNRDVVLNQHIRQYQMKKTEKDLKSEHKFGSYKGLIGHITATATHNVVDERLKQIKTKHILVITSSDDKWVKVLNQHHLASSSLNCKHLAVPNSSHGVNVEKSEEISLAIESNIYQAEQNVN